MKIKKILPFTQYKPRKEGVFYVPGRQNQQEPSLLPIKKERNQEGFLFFRVVFRLVQQFFKEEGEKWGKEGK